MEVQEDHAYGWKIVDEPPFCVPFTGTPWINVPVPEDPKPIDFFNMLFKNEMWTEITTQTNVYAENRLATEELKEKSRWFDNFNGFTGLTTHSKNRAT